MVLWKPQLPVGEWRCQEKIRLTVATVILILFERSVGQEDSTSVKRGKNDKICSRRKKEIVCSGMDVTKNDILLILVLPK